MDSFHNDPTDRINRCSIQRLIFFRGGAAVAQVVHQGNLICSQLSWIKEG
jgi:hypothetical protein